MYELFIILYNIGVWVASFFSKKVRTMWKGEHRTFRVLREKIDPNAMYIWFHAASLGEFEQGRPIMEAIRREHPGYKILLTFFSPSGYEVRKNYDGADVVVYLPIETKRNARRFMRLTNPVMAFFIKYEFWSNYLHMLKERHVPTFSVSSIFRPNQIFFRAYGKGYGKVLDCFTHFFVQNEESRDLLKSIGIDCVSVTGDTRFDRVLQIRDAGKSLPIVENLVGGTAEDRPHVFIAGSSWPP
uniref:3-deoxy-D-manno-octulosonic acid transferase n=1 Tax=Prevotella sp. TaxID=59823 RepID=UPI003FF06B60